MQKQNSRRVKAAKIGYQALVKKYPLEIRREWARRGAQKLNKMITSEIRSAGGKAQKIGAKSLGGLMAARRKITSTEIEVQKLLNNLKIPHTFGGIIHANVRPFPVDFVIPNDDKPQIAVYVTNQKSGTVGESLAYCVLKLRETYPKLTFVALIDDHMANAGKIALIHEGVHVFYTSQLGKLSEWLKARWSSPKPQGVKLAV